MSFAAAYKTSEEVREQSFTALYHSYKRSARDRGYEWNLDKEQFRELTQQNCYYCGAPPHRIKYSDYALRDEGYQYNGIDRADNKEGYFFRNCRPCCWDCNDLKGSLSEPYFLDLVLRIANYQNRA